VAQADKDVVSKAIIAAAKDWRSAKRRERAARDAFAALVVDAVKRGVLTENKITNMTEFPRMTIRKMLGKS
jgi:hypothetical protein